MMNTKFNVKTFQGMILALQDFWASKGCSVVQPFKLMALNTLRQVLHYVRHS